MSGCAVCGSPLAEVGVPCARCGFLTPHGKFFSQQHYQTWLRDSVIPYRQKWQKESVIYRMEERIAALEKQVQEMQEQLRQLTDVWEKKPVSRTESIPKETIPLSAKKKRVYTNDDVRVAVRDGQSEFVIPSDVTEIGEEAFLGSFLQEIKIPDGVTRIGKGSFQLCYNLRWVSLPNSVMEIGEWSFAICGSLEKIVFSDSLMEIGERSFVHCTSLEKIVFPANLRRIGYLAFRGCIHLANIKFLGAEKLEIAEHAFEDVTATVYYPKLAIGAPWVGKDYGGELTWIAQ